jgi:hypothetical protein
LQPIAFARTARAISSSTAGMRLAALQSLAQGGRYSPDATKCPVIVDDETDAEAREVSLALNVARTAMHPVDEYRAFAALHNDKDAPQTWRRSRNASAFRQRPSSNVSRSAHWTKAS